MFIKNFGFSPRKIANTICQAFETLPEFTSASQDNTERMALIHDLISNVPARKKLMEMQRGYVVTTGEEPDQIIYAGFSKETAKKFIENFEKYLEENKDSMEALRIIYNTEDTLITRSMLQELRDRLLSESRQYGARQIWKNYKVLDETGNVEELDTKANLHALTHLIQIVRYAYKKNQKLTSLINGYAKRFSLYCGQAQRELTEEQKDVMRQVAQFVIQDGALTPTELNVIDTNLWRRGIRNFGVAGLAEEMQSLARFLLKAA